MTYDQLFRAVKAGDIAPVYVLYGQEQYVRDSAVEAFKKKLLPEGMEQLCLSVFEGAATVGELIDSAETLPFMSDKRLVIVKDWAMLNARADSGDADRFSKWLETVPNTCCMLFVQSEAPDSRKKLSQALKSHAEWVAFDLLSDAELYKWCARFLKSSGHELEPAAMEQLTFMAGRALTGLTQELEKLCAYVGERTRITRADVEAIVTPSTECTVFQMIDCLMRRQSGRAQLLLKAMLENGETRIGTLAMLTRQMRMLTHIRLMRAQGQTLAEIEKKLSFNHYAATRAAEQAGRFSAEGLEAGYRACVETDYAIKSGRMRDSAALDALMLRLADLK